MVVYLVGSIIKEARKRMGLSQEEVCHGICSVSALSKIENGSQNPTFKTIFALLERTGLSPHSVDHYVSKSELKKYKLETEILHRIFWNKDLRESIIAYSNIMCTTNNIDCQILETAKIVEEDKDKITLKKIDEVLSYTVKNAEKFYDRPLKTYTSYEMILLCLKSQKLMESDKREESQLILDCLLEYWKRFAIDLEYRTTQYLYLLHFVILHYYEVKEYTHAYEVCLEGINICTKYGNFYLFIELLADCGLICWKLGEISDAEEWLKKALCAGKALQDSRYQILQKTLREIYYKQKINLPIL